MNQAHAPLDYSRSLLYSSFFLLLLAGTAVLWGEIIGFALLISRLGLDALPLIMMIEAVLSLVWIIGAETVRGRIHDGWIVVAICGLALALMLVGGALVETHFIIGYALFYLTRRLLRDMLLYHTWNTVTGYYHIGLRFLLPRLGLMTQFAVACGGLILAALSLFLSLGQLVNLWGLVIFLTLVAVALFVDEFHAIDRPSRQTEASNASATALTSAFRSLGGSSLMRLLSLCALCMSVSVSVLLYQAGAIFYEVFETDTTLIRWLGFFYAITMLLTLPVQYRLLPNLLERFSVASLAAAYPVMVGFSVIGVFVWPYIGMAALADTTRQTLHNTFYAPLHIQIRNALPASVRSWVYLIIDGLIEPIGHFLAGFLLLFWVADALPTAAFYALLVGFAFLFMVGQWRAGTIYQSMVRQAIDAGHYGFLHITSPEQLSAYRRLEAELLNRLKSAALDVRSLLPIAEALAENGSKKGFDALLGIYPGSPPGLQAELLLLLAQGWPRQRTGETLRELVAEALTRDYPGLRRAALTVMTLYPTMFDSYNVMRYLIDRDSSVSTLAAQLLLHHPSPRLMRAAQAQLNWLSRSPHAQTRAQAVLAMQHGGVNRHGERVIPIDTPRFLKDRSARVRLAIIPSLALPELVEAASDPSPTVRKGAQERLKRQRRAAIRPIMQQLSGELTEGDVAAHLGRWYLLTALASLNPQQGLAYAPEALEKGLFAFDRLSSMRATLHHMDYPPLKPLMIQLGNDRVALVNAMIHYLVAAFPSQAHMKPLLRHEMSDDALNTLAGVVGATLAGQFKAALQSQWDEDVYVTHNPAACLDDPADVVRLMLSQPDEWRPLLTLYAFSAIPHDTFFALADLKQVAAILERGRLSDSDAVREATRLIRQALHGENNPQRAEFELSCLLPDEQGTRTMLSTIERMLFLRNVSFFEHLRLDQLRTLARVCHERTANAGDTIIRKGEVGESLFIVVEGRIRVIAPATEEKRATELAVLTPGEVLGEISLFDGGVRSADAVAETPVLLLVVGRENLDDALADDPGIASDMLRVMAQRVRQSNEARQRDLQDVIQEL